MKKLLFPAVAALLLLAGCKKEQSQTDSTKLSREERIQAHVKQMTSLFANSRETAKDFLTDSRGFCNSVPICHKGKSIVVNGSAVPAHMNHGDQLTCCATPCLNEALPGVSYDWYYDTDVNDCFDLLLDGYEQITMGFGDNGISVEAYTSNGVTEYFIYTFSQINGSLLCHDFEATQAEYECAIAYLKSVIAANSCIPNFCDLA